MNVKKVAIFVGLTFLVSYSIVPLYFALGGTKAMPGMLILSVVYMFMPLSVAVVVQKLVYHASLKDSCRINFRPNRWFLVAWLLPPVIALGTLGVALLLPGVGFSSHMAGMFERFQGLVTPEQLEEMKQQAEALPIHPFWLGLLQGLVAGVTVNAVAAFGEELGWRGLLLRELESLGFWRAALCLRPPSQRRQKRYSLGWLKRKCIRDTGLRTIETPERATSMQPGPVLQDAPRTRSGERVGTSTQIRCKST